MSLSARHYGHLSGVRFNSFADLGRAIHQADIDRARKLSMTRAARTANKRKGSNAR